MNEKRKTKPRFQGVAEKIQTRVLRVRINALTYAAFTHAGLTIRYRMWSLYKSIFVLPRLRNI